MPEAENQTTESQDTAQENGAAEEASENPPVTAPETGEGEGQPTQEDWKALALQYKEKAEKYNAAQAQGVFNHPQQNGPEIQQPPAQAGTGEWDKKVAEARRQLEYNAFELNDPTAIVTLANEQKANQSIAQAAVQSYPEDIRSQVWTAYNTGQFATLEAARLAVIGYQSLEKQKELAAERARIEAAKKEIAEQAQRRTEGVRSTTKTPLSDVEVNERTIKQSEANELLSRPPNDPEAVKFANDLAYGRKTIIPG